jgi:hypothetical protein
MTAALIAQRTRGPGVDLRTEVDAAVVVLGGQLRHASLRALHDGGLRLLADSWRLADRDVHVIAESLRSVIGPQAVFGPSSLPTLIPEGVVSDFALAPSSSAKRSRPAGPGTWPCGCSQACGGAAPAPDDD